MAVAVLAAFALLGLTIVAGFAYDLQRATPPRDRLDVGIA